MRIALRRPSVRSAAVTVLVVLTFGIAIGATIGPTAVGETSAVQQPTVVLASAPAPAPIAPAATEPIDDVALDESEPAEAPATETPESTTDISAEPAASDPPAATDPEEERTDTADEDGDEEDPAPDVAPPGSKALAGVVVETDADGQGFALAARDGRLLAIHAAGCGVAPGDDLHLRARKLANGTWAADRIRRVGDGVAIARAEGVVSWVDPAGGRYALSARGTTLLVAIPASAAADPATAVVPPVPIPVVGERLRVRLQLQPAEGDVPASLTEQLRAALPSPDPAATPVAPLEPDGTSNTAQTVPAACIDLDVG